MQTTWRLIIDGPACGAWNMGVDEALLATAAEEGVSTLRFYHWDGPWLSLGYAQRQLGISLDDCERLGIGVVRRVTGGGAVLHGCDLTYSIAAPESALPPGLQASYGLVADAMVEAFAELGVRAVRNIRDRAQHGVRGFDCFALPAADEICAQGKKLVGSAQRRAGGGVLQHGSIRIEPDLEEIAQVAGVSPGVSTSLSELGCEGSFEEAREALMRALSQALSASFVPGVLLPSEGERVRKRQEAYQRNPLTLPRVPRRMPPQAPIESADTNT